MRGPTALPGGPAGTPVLRGLVAALATALVAGCSAGPAAVGVR